MKKSHATAVRIEPETEISSNEALPVGGEASGTSLAPAPPSDDGDMSGVGAGGEEAVGASDELEGPSEESSELESGLAAGVLADDDFGDFAVLPLPEDGEGLGVAVEFFLAMVGAAVGGEVGGEAVAFGDAEAAGEGEVEFFPPLAFGALAGVGGSAAKTAVTAKAATARDRSLSVIVILFVKMCVNMFFLVWYGLLRLVLVSLDRVFFSFMVN
ncbi:PREDICTED: uncharacterized protein LOC109126568 [Camelina sativa]|uniref:Uncharacterized protein LOC109126568 n=1 Tax=Camelina sativa TaxID=90675 RepID=A0ABM1QGA5_CAMSA|nr:PREDICTED: uncharacterized protein LOC109126568 [Camelina sativa]